MSTRTARLHHLRVLSVFVASFSVVPYVAAQDAVSDDAAPVERTAELTVDPAAAPVPLFRYRLLPASYELIEGNALPIYLRLVHERRDEWRDALDDQAVEILDSSLDELSRDEAEKFLASHANVVEQMAGAALRSQCDFEYITEGVDPVQILLPDVQQLRSYGRFLAARSRCQMLVGDYAAAVGTLRDGMALARHTAEGPFIVHDLVGVAIARMIFARAQELVAQPGAPNLYWAFAAFPEPTIDIRSALEFESTILAMRFPELDQLDRLRSPEQWQLLRSEIATWANDLRKWNAGSDSGGGQANDPASDTERIAAAREDLTDRYGYSEDQVQNMSDAEVAVRHTVHLSREVSDEIYAISCVPFWETGPLFEHLENSVEPRLRDREVYPAVYQALMISAKAILQAPATLEEQRRALTVVEALRMHAAATGELPQALSDVQVVPVPNSYYTNEPFHYELSDGVATLTSDAPEGVAQAVAIDYRIRLRE